MGTQHLKISLNNNEVFIVGDTINIIGLFTNYLTSISGVSVSLSTSSPYINIVDGLTNLPILNALDTNSARIGSNKFLI